MIQTAYADNFYKWTDADGSTHYGQQPPPKALTKQVQVDSNAPKSSENSFGNITPQNKQTSKAMAKKIKELGCQMLRESVPKLKAQESELNSSQKVSLLRGENTLHTQCDS